MLLRQYSLRFLGTIVVCLMGQTTVSNAAGYGGASGVNSLGQVIIIGTDGPTEIIVYQSTKMARDSDPGISYNFWEECENIAGDKVVDCRKGTKSPLRGAVFSRRSPNDKKYKDGCGGYATILICETGCKPRRVPKLLIEDAWEC